MNHGFLIRTAAACFATAAFSCTVGPQVKDGTIVTTNEKARGYNITLRFTRGQEFGRMKRVGFMKLILTPQIAVWTEDTQGNYIQTLYVTRKFAKQDWGPAPHNKDSCFRTSSLPYWLNKYVKAGNAAPTTNKPLPDGITSATPPGCFDLKTTITASPFPVVVKVEVNSAFDHDSAYNSRRKASKINGQPAVVYTARTDRDPRLYPVVQMDLAGHSGEESGDPALYHDLSGLTTAKEIFSCINLYVPLPAGSDMAAQTGATPRAGQNGQTEQPDVHR